MHSLWVFFAILCLTVTAVLILRIRSSSYPTTASSDQIQVLSFSEIISIHHEHRKAQCRDRTPWPANGSVAERFHAANCHFCEGIPRGWPEDGDDADKYGAAMCGTQFALEYFAGQGRKVNIRFAGTVNYQHDIKLSGCRYIRVAKHFCPGIEHCGVRISKLNGTDVQPNIENEVVIYSARASEHSLLDDYMENRSHTTYVLFMRETGWTISQATQAKFSYIMGFPSTLKASRFFSNPNFLLRPYTLLYSYPPCKFEEQKNFAMNIASDCKEGAAFRMDFITKLSEALGADKVHRYGTCGDRSLPPKPMENAAEIIRTYKFYFSFENSIRDAYVTEKLYSVLKYGPIPVYLGAPDAMSITRTKSYINVLSYDSMEELVDHLQHLSENETAYNEYHQWRQQGVSAFTDEYLYQVSRHFPGKELFDQAKSKLRDPTDKKHLYRGLTCCKLCSLPFLEQDQSGNQPLAIPRRWPDKKIRQRLDL